MGIGALVNPLLFKKF